MRRKEIVALALGFVSERSQLRIGVSQGRHGFGFLNCQGFVQRRMHLIEQKDVQLTDEGLGHRAKRRERTPVDVYLKFVRLLKFARVQEFLANDFDHTVLQLLFEGEVFAG